MDNKSLLLLLWHINVVFCCHYTTIIIQNGTVLNTTGWAHNSFLDNGTYGETGLKPPITTDNPVLPNTPVIPNKKQDCICGGFGLKDLYSNTLSKSKELSGKTFKPPASYSGAGLDSYYVSAADTPATQKASMGARLTKLFDQVGGYKPQLFGLYRPWIAKIIIYKPDSSQVICTGVLVNSQFVLTAAHCLCDTFLPCSSKGPKSVFDHNDEFMPTEENKGKPMIEVYLGAMAYSDDAVVSYEVSEMVIHDEYKQDEESIGSRDIALIKLKGKGIPRNSLIQPICLPPQNMGEEEEDKPADPGQSQAFTDLDCFLASKDSPFPFATLSGRKRVCHPLAHDGKHSFITGFKDVAKKNSTSKCRTNGFGSTDSGTLCASECKKTDPPQDEQCQELLEKLQPEASHINRFDVSNDTRCFPLLTLMANKTNVFYSPYTQGWCQACAGGNDTDDEEKCTGEENWGYCATECAEDSGGEKDAKSGMVHEIAVQTYKHNPDEPDNCEVPDPSQNLEFCTGMDMTTMTVATVQDNKIVAYKMESIKTNSSSEDKKFATLCYGDAGAPVWKYHTFTNAFKRGLKLAVVTGLVSRHEHGCNSQMKDTTDPQISIHTRIRQPSDRDLIMKWILEKSSSGSCGDSDYIENRTKRVQ